MMNAADAVSVYLTGQLFQSYSRLGQSSRSER